MRRETGAFRIPGIAGTSGDEVVREWPVRGGANASASLPAFGGLPSFGAPHTLPPAQVRRSGSDVNDRLTSLGAATLLDAMRQENVGGSSGGVLQTLLDKATSVPASAQDRLVLMPQFLPWAKFDAAAVRINRRDDMDSLSELRAHERSGRAIMRSWADRLDPDVPTTAKVVQELSRDRGKARRERGLTALQFAEGLARQGAVLLPGQPVDKDFVELCKRALFLFAYEQERTWLAFKVPKGERRP